MYTANNRKFTKIPNLQFLLVIALYQKTLKQCKEKKSFNRKIVSKLKLFTKNRN